MKMNNQELIAECKRGIKNTNRWLRENKDIGNPENAAKKQLQIYEIALAALTAAPPAPVKLPPAWWVRQAEKEFLAYPKDMVIEALKASGVEVAE